MEEVAERARQEVQEREAARFAPFCDDLRAAALSMPLGDLIELIGWERLGKRGPEGVPKQEDALDPWLGGRTAGDDRASRGTARGGR